MASRVRRVCGDLLVSIGVLGAVLGVLVSVDPRVRDQLQAAVNVTSAVGLGAVGGQLRDVGITLFDAARTHSIEQAPLVIFSVVATVLLLALART
jgi:hypothetical protein